MKKNVGRSVPKTEGTGVRTRVYKQNRSEKSTQVALFLCLIISGITLMTQVKKERKER